jgi:hypothetical protein
MTVGYLKYLFRDHERIYVHVSNIFIAKRPMLVEIKMGARSNSAILTSGWDMLVRKFNLMKDDKVLFFFSERDDGDLDLVVDVLPQVLGD